MGKKPKIFFFYKTVQNFNSSFIENEETILEKGFNHLWKFEFENAEKCFKYFENKNNKYYMLLTNEIDLFKIIISGRMDLIQNFEIKLDLQIKIFEGFNK